MMGTLRKAIGRRAAPDVLPSFGEGSTFVSADVLANGFSANGGSTVTAMGAAAQAGSRTAMGAAAQAGSSAADDVESEPAGGSSGGAPGKSAKSGLMAARTYSIRVASRLTSIPADTLRMWERRYGFPRPERTGGGSRTYSEEDIELLHLLSRALKAGYRPGEIVGKARAELEDILVQVAPAAPEPVAGGAMPSVRGLVQHLMADETELLSAELRRAALRLGSKRFVTDIAHPFTVSVGTLWEQGKIEVRHEHLATEALSTLLRLLLSTSEDGLERPVVLLATLPGEQHGLGLEMVALYLAASRATPRLLGVNTPRDQIVKAARALQVDVVGLTVSPSSNPITAAADIRWMLSELPRRVEVWAGGEGATKLALAEPGLKLVTSFRAIDEAVDGVRGK